MISGIILASGFSKRMGQDKLLMDVHGKKMLEWVIIASMESSLDQIILIYRNEKIREIGDKYNIKSIYNPKAHLGQSEGLKLGVRQAMNSDAYMFLLGDQPFIDSDFINLLIDKYKENKNSIIVPSYKGRNGPPSIFPSSYRDKLLTIEGDKGAREIIDKNPNLVEKVKIYDEKLGFDIDKPSDFKIIK